MSAFFCRKLAFFVQKSTFTQSNSVRAVLEIFLVFVRQMVTLTENISFACCVQNLAFGLLQIGRKSEKWQLCHIFPTWRQHHIFFDVILFLLSSLVTGPRFMSISSLVLGLWQFSFIKDWPEIQKSEIPPFEFCPISGDWGKLWIPNLERMSLIEC